MTLETTILVLARITATEQRNVFSTAGQDKSRGRKGLKIQGHLFKIDHEILLLKRLIIGR